MWPSFVPRLRDYEGLAPYCCSRPAAAAPTRIRGRDALTRRKIGYWRLGNGLLTSRMRAYVPMCESGFEHQGASAGVLGDRSRSCGTRLRVDFGLGKASRAGVG